MDVFYVRSFINSTVGRPYAAVSFSFPLSLPREMEKSKFYYIMITEISAM